MAKLQVLLVINLLSVHLHSVQCGLFTPHKKNDSSKSNKTEQSDRKHDDGDDDEDVEEDEDSSDDEQSSDDEDSLDDEDIPCDGLISNLLKTVTNLIAQIGPIQILSNGDVNSEQKIEKKGQGNKQSSEDDGHSEKSSNHTTSKKGRKEKSYGLIIDLLNLVTDLLAQIGPIQLLSAGDIHNKQSIEKDDDE